MSAIILPHALDALYTLQGLRAFLSAQELSTTKALGQNFLFTRPVLEAMLNAAQLPCQGTVIEIGPGVGHLTWMLLARGLSVVAIEYDRTFAHALRLLDKERLAHSPTSAPRLTLIEADALSFDFDQAAQEYNANHVLGNLPYNVAVPILFRLAFARYAWKGLYVTIQKEVGDRILAHAGNRTYGRLSIVLNYLCAIKKLRIISPHAFFPRPQVDSVFIELVSRPDADKTFAADYLERLVMLGFSHRRKKLRSQLKNAIVEQRILNEERLDKLSAVLDLDRRAEALDLDDWVRLAEWVKQLQIDDCGLQ